MDQNREIIDKSIHGSLSIIDQDREREIISRRFGISGQKETLEQIGEMLGITRERVRQLEKAILIRLRINAEENKIPELNAVEKIIIRELSENGRVLNVSTLAEKLLNKPTASDVAKLVFISGISAHLTLIEESDKYHTAVAISDYGDAKSIKLKVDELAKLIKANKAPMSIEELDQQLNYEHPKQIASIAAISKSLSELNKLWGLSKWPAVNPRNIRDKIFVVLESHKEPMHFSEIADAIKSSKFKRRDVTIQAIHNELIKDSRFVLIGRGIYALESWGYIRGTVSEIITQIIKSAGKPLTREEIVKRVLKTRKVKETTILLNLQNKKHFKKVSKNTFDIA